MDWNIKEKEFNKYEKAMIRLGLDFTDTKLMGLESVSEDESEGVLNDEAIADVKLILDGCWKAELFDNVASGKTIIFCGKSVVMMNHKKYIQYLDNTQFEEPYSKNLLRAENKELKENNARFLKKCERWLELLKTDGINSKSMVANDIQHLLKEMKQDEKD